MFIADDIVGLCRIIDSKIFIMENRNEKSVKNIRMDNKRKRYFFY